MSQKLKVAVIGLGNIGSAVATNLVKGSRPVILADKTFAKSKTLAERLGTLAKAAPVSEAVREADIIVLAIYFEPIKAFFKEHADELEGKIIVDPSNPIAPAEDGGFKKIIGENESAGQLLSKELPAGVKMAKALGSLGVVSLAGAAYQTDKAVLFYATDDTLINNTIEELISDSGFYPMRIGGLDQSIRIEVFGDLHEFGALAKPVTRAEAEQKI